MTDSTRTTRRIVITGGPGSGKTTLVRALAERGYPTVPEVAIQIIEELNEKHGVDGQKTWRRAHGTEFQRMILDRQVQLETGLADDLGPVFLDRGRHDGLAYCRFRGDEPPPGLLEALEGWRYDAVIQLTTLANFEERQATGRMSSREDSVAIGGQIVAAYREYGMDVIIVPELPVEARVDRVLQFLAE